MLSVPGPGDCPLLDVGRAVAVRLVHVEGEPVLGRGRNLPLTRTRRRRSRSGRHHADGLAGAQIVQRVAGAGLVYLDHGGPDPRRNPAGRPAGTPTAAVLVARATRTANACAARNAPAAPVSCAGASMPSRRAASSRRPACVAQPARRRGIRVWIGHGLVTAFLGVGLVVVPGRPHAVPAALARAPLRRLFSARNNIEQSGSRTGAACRAARGRRAARSPRGRWPRGRVAAVLGVPPRLRPVGCRSAERSSAPRRRTR